LSDPRHFIDANIPMYAVGAEHPLKAPCVAILEQIANGARAGVTDVEVLQEILYRYTALGQRDRSVAVAERFLAVVPDVLPIGKEEIIQAMKLHTQLDRLPPRDSLHLAVMMRNGIRLIISADRHFDGIPEIVRLDPADWPF